MTILRHADQASVITWAQEILKLALILDTETTGLHDGEICQIAVVSSTGEVLMDTFVKPVAGIPADATAIHGITNEMVDATPGWADVIPQLMSLLSGSDLVVYNAVYDRKMMHRSAEAARLPKIEWRTVARWHCAMERYAAFYGDWNDYHQSYRWQSLINACHQMGIGEINAPAHSGLGDCLRTLALLKALAAWQPEA